MPANDGLDAPLFLIGGKAGTPAAASAVREVAQKLAQFIGGAASSLHVAIYDFQLSDNEAKSWRRAMDTMS